MSAFGKLRAVQDDDVMMLLAWRNHPDIRLKMYNAHIINETEHLEWWRHARERDDRRYFIYERDGEPSGSMAITAIDGQNSRANWGFYLSPNALRGSGSRMNFLALRYVFDDLKLNKLCGEVLSSNGKSIRLHQRLGFSTEGVLREHHRAGGKFEDVHLFGLLRDEWQRARDAIEASLVELEGRTQ